MINTRIMTTKEKKYIEKTLGILGITVDDLLEIQNLREMRSELELLRKEYKEAIEKVNEYRKTVEKNSEITANMSVQVQEALTNFESRYFEANQMKDDEEADN